MTVLLTDNCIELCCGHAFHRSAGLCTAGYSFLDVLLPPPTQTISAPLRNVFREQHAQCYVIIITLHYLYVTVYYFVFCMMRFFFSPVPPNAAHARVLTVLWHNVVPHRGKSSSPDVGTRWHRWRPRVDVDGQPAVSQQHVLRRTREPRRYY